LLLKLHIADGGNSYEATRPHRCAKRCGQVWLRVFESVGEEWA